MRNRRQFRRSSFVTSSAQAASRLSSPRPVKLSTLSGKVYGQLDPFQKDATKWCLQRNEAALFFEQGTGKTWITGAVIEQLLTVKGTQSILLIVPLANLETTWLEFVRKLRVNVCLHWSEFADCPFPKILLLHYEAVTPVIKKLRRVRWSLIVYDEAQRLKARGSLASRTAAKLRNSAQRKMILTGTPIDENPKDLWAQFRFLRPDLLGKWKDFERQFLVLPDIDLKKCRPGSFRFQKMLRELVIQRNKAPFRPDMLPVFLDLIKPYCLRVTKEVLNLRALNVIPVPIKLRGTQRELYDLLEKNLVVEDGDLSITTPLKMTQLWKLHQTCGGFVIDDDQEVRFVGDTKLNRLLGKVYRTKLPLVIFAYYTAEIKAIAEELANDYTVAVISGENRKFRPQIIRAFQAGKIDILICQNKSGGVGIDLFNACTAFVYSFRHSHIDFDQLKARLHRRGQKNIVNIFLFYALATVDEDVYNTLIRKGNLVEQVLDRLRRRPNGKGESSGQEGRRGKEHLQVQRGNIGQGPRNSRNVRPRRPA